MTLAKYKKKYNPTSLWKKTLNYNSTSITKDNLFREMYVK